MISTAFQSFQDSAQAGLEISSVAARTEQCSADGSSAQTVR